ncbi:MAG: thioredoxin [Bacteroidetes bacterium]|uniref:Thioredoxin n=1 Tax=Candidatus Merdivivens pullistercoris TaxID=2840873 RepID=A0A9D9N9F4_9BACT|nr:thioredoxin [Candidatus Merdivivens pullistercoris]
MKNSFKILLTAGIIFLMSAFSACGQNVGAGKNDEKMNTIKIDKAQFLEKIYNYEKNPQTWKYEGDKPAIVDFFATWCGPCKALGPVLEELAEEYEGKIYIYKVDVDQEPELSGAFGIRSVPTLLFIPANGEPSMSPGAPSKAQLKQIIEGHLLK